MAMRLLWLSVIVLSWPRDGCTSKVPLSMLWMELWSKESRCKSRKPRNNDFPMLLMLLWARVKILVLFGMSLGTWVRPLCVQSTDRSDQAHLQAFGHAVSERVTRWSSSKESKRNMLSIFRWCKDLNVLISWYVNLLLWQLTDIHRRGTLRLTCGNHYHIVVKWPSFNQVIVDHY